MPVAGPTGPRLRLQVLVLDELARFGVKVHFTDAPDLAADDPQAVLLTRCRA